MKRNTCPDRNCSNLHTFVQAIIGLWEFVCSWKMKCICCRCNREGKERLCRELEKLRQKKEDVDAKIVAFGEVFTELEVKGFLLFKEV